jgi:hypothetical protein
MPTIYKVTVTKPSLESLCILEILEHTLFFEFNSFPISARGYVDMFAVLQLPGYIEYFYSPAITWIELNNRRSELRPDLLFQSELIDMEIIMKNPNIYGIYTPWNPFELSMVSYTVFDTEMNALNAIDKFLHTKDDFAKIGSVVNEELLVEGTIKTNFTKRYS